MNRTRVRAMGTAAAFFALCLTGNVRAAAVEPPPAQEPAKEMTLDLGHDVKLSLVLVPAGKFMMGSPENEAERRPDEGPQHEVTISKAFYMSATEVTQEQYEAVMGALPDIMNKLDGVAKALKNRKLPVIWVSWFNAEDFCLKLSKAAKVKARIPTEAEWEYACRAGTKTRFCCGDDEKTLRTFAWFWGRLPLPAGSRKPNPWGLYDMHGNVWEWVADWYGPYADQAATDPAGPGKGETKVLRGGCWHNSAKFCRSAGRNAYPPSNADYDFGIRIVVDVK